MTETSFYLPHAHTHMSIDSWARLDPSLCARGQLTARTTHNLMKLDKRKQSKGLRQLLDLDPAALKLELHAAA